MTSAFQQRMFQEASAKCIVCPGDEENGSQLFQCSFAPAIWPSQEISWVNVTSEETFWGSLTGGTLGGRWRREGSLQCYGQNGCTVMRLPLK